MRFTSLPVELIRARPRLMVWIVTLALTALWLAVPLLVYGSPPGDVAMRLAYGREYQVGIAAGPPLAFWLADIAFRFAGNHIAGVYLLTQLCIMATYWAVFALSRAIVGPQHAVLAVLLTATITFFGFPSLDFGPDVLAQPLWTLLVVSVWRIVGQGRRSGWFTFSTTAGLLLLTTPAAPVLLLFVAAFALATRRGRRALLSFDPLLALIAIVVLALPYLMWLIRAGDLPPAAWPALPPWREAMTQWGALVGIMAASLIGLAALVAVGSLPVRGNRDEAPDVMRRPVAPFARTFVLVFALVPPLGGALLSVLTGHDRVVGGAGTLLSLSGLAAMVLMRERIALHHRPVLRAIWAAAVAAPALAVIAAALFQPWLGQHELATAPPARAIGTFFAENFARRTGQPLPVVAGDPQLAALIGMSAPRPHVFLDATPERTPWLTLDDVRKSGGVVVWRATDTAGAAPPETAARFPGLVPELPRAFSRLVDGRLPPLRIGWAIVRPAAAP
ncbi:MAG: hypothetical protein DCC74_03395 [Proteobacteria bacterium]|nr:MAG: hypothetical protein DCC74_03395 [Pseudomonadota bacterium]